MDNTEETTKDRLKASELLVKSKGGFIDRMELDADVSPIVIRNDVTE